MVHRLPISQARINLGAVVNRAHLTKEEYLAGKSRPLEEFRAERRRHTVT